jgi:hypothetical protein
VKGGGGEEGVRVKGRAWGCDYATARHIEVDPQRFGFGRRECDACVAKFLDTTYEHAQVAHRPPARHKHPL